LRLGPPLHAFLIQISRKIHVELYLPSLGPTRYLPLLSLFFALLVVKQHAGLKVVPYQIFDIGPVRHGYDLLNLVGVDITDGQVYL
jgi:hypothetical protein